MERTIVSRDVDNATAHIIFTHEGVTVEQNFDLVAVVPGTLYFLAAQGRQLTEDEQGKHIEYLEASLQRQIDSGAIKPAPAPADPLTLPPIPKPEPDTGQGELPLIDPEAL